MNLTIPAIVAVLFLSLATAAPVSAGETEDAIAEKLSNAVPGLRVTSVQKSEAKGLCRAITGIPSTPPKTAFIC
jgi:thiol:disulfide interchange protein DsbC